MRSPGRPTALSALVLLATLALLPACDAAERVRARFVTTDTMAAIVTGSGLMLGLQAPGQMRQGEEGILRLSLANQSDTVVTRIRLELIVPGWVEPMPPRQGDREVSMTALDNLATRFAYRMDETPLQPGETQSVEQRIRVPASGPLTDGSEPWSRVVRARLLDADGQLLAEVESQIALEGVHPVDTSTVSATGAGRDQIGPLRLGMNRAALQQAASGARDTTWSNAGASQQGMVTPVSGGRTLIALSGDTVSRLEVRGAAPQTREQVGVGSRMDELVGAYGQPCAFNAEGAVLVRFAQAPGVTFALDTAVPSDAAQARAALARIPATSRVTRWWLSRDATGCP
ncbi:MAG: hypothetical protein H0U67_09475 [Gemmatimonadetes bacterium]|nr:hypothetical protein [Gemmatimonadota bacterium]